MSLALTVERLGVAVPRRGASALPILDGVSFEVAKGEILAIVGESGSGKSLTALAIMGLLPPQARVTQGTVRFDGRDLLTLPDADRRRLRGARIGMVFQEPMTSLNPVLTIGRQMTEALIEHERLSSDDAKARGLAMLHRVGLGQDAGLLRRYPHELSGGMRQRVMIAMAMVLRPALLIADEPTTALDVTVQAQILQLLRDLVRTTGAGLLIITHDMGVVAELADRVAVMRRGRIVETRAVRELFGAPRQAYTRSLLAAVPRLDGPGQAPRPLAERGQGPILRLDRISKSYGSQGMLRPRRGPMAVDDISLSVSRGETLAIVGESGSGKSTLGRAAARLIDVDAGRVIVDGRDLTRVTGRRLREARSIVQMIFQDPFASLDPRWPLLATVEEPMLARGGVDRRTARNAAAALMDRVGLPKGMSDRRPHEMSGGQRQRVAIARALAARPDIIVADEPTSALDVSVQAQVLDLLAELQRDLGLAFLFISHDLAVVRAIAHRVAVMRAGRLVELGPADAVLGRPRHAYTQALIAAAPVPDPTRPRPAAPSEPVRERGPVSFVEEAPRHWVAR